MSPTSTNGKICYVELPALDVTRSADFYAKVFGWKIRKRGNGHTAFDDAMGTVSGTWVTGRTRSRPRLLLLVGGRFPPDSASLRTEEESGERTGATPELHSEPGPKHNLPGKTKGRSFNQPQNWLSKKTSSGSKPF